tara:strand:+ start:390 stop:644 length:255 start_codon:yes stop_codon:yes gene_type:complete
MKNYFEKIENKLKEHLKFEDLIIIDNTHLHVKHKSYVPGKLHLHIKIKSEYLKSISRINAQRFIMKLLKEDLKNNIHALEITIN